MKTEMQQCPGVETYAGETRLIPDVARVNAFIVRGNDGVVQRVASCPYLSGDLCNRVLTDTKLPQDPNRSPIRPKCVFYEPIAPPVQSQEPTGISLEQPVVDEPVVESGEIDMHVELPSGLQSDADRLPKLFVVKPQDEIIEEADYEIRDGAMYVKEGKRFPLFPLLKTLPTEELQYGYDNEENFEAHKQPINFQGVKGEVILTAQFEEREWVYGDAENPSGTSRLAGTWEWSNDHGEELLTVEEAPLAINVQFFPDTFDDYKKVRPFEIALDCAGKEYELSFGEEEYYTDEETFDDEFEELKTTLILRDGAEKPFLLPWDEKALAALTGEIVRDPEFEEEFEEQMDDLTGAESQDQFLSPPSIIHEVSLDLNTAEEVEYGNRQPNLLRRFLHLRSQ